MKEDQIELFKNLYSVVQKYLEKVDYFLVNEDEYLDIFYTNLYKVIEFAFDLNLSVRELEEFVDSHKDKSDAIALGSFIIKTIDDHSTYTLLNYYLLKFIVISDEIVKKPHVKDIEIILKMYTIGEEEVQKVFDAYKELTELHKS